MCAKFENLDFELLGHSSVRIESNKVIYIDPWSEVIDKERKDADIIFISHDDHDHYDLKGINMVSKESTVVVLYSEIDEGGISQQVQKIGAEQKARIKDVSVETISGYNLEDGAHVDEEGKPFHAKGEVVGFLLKLNGVRIFYPSDTDLLPRHKEIEADVVIPPIGGHYTMNCNQALELIGSINPELVLPVHYNTFEAIEVDESAFKRDLEKKGFRVSLF